MRTWKDMWLLRNMFFFFFNWVNAQYSVITFYKPVIHLNILVIFRFLRITFYKWQSIYYLHYKKCQCCLHLYNVLVRADLAAPWLVIALMVIAQLEFWSWLESVIINYIQWRPTSYFASKFLANMNRALGTAKYKYNGDSISFY